MKVSGATLLELLVTLTIVMILASVAMPLTRVSPNAVFDNEVGLPR
jgi:type II secretory pathway pseudopilin PulG